MKKTIIIFVHSLGVGGMERVVSELVNHFSKNHSLKIHVVLFGSKREVFYTISNKIILHRPEFVYNENKRFFHTIKTILFLRRKIKELKPNSILSFGEYWNNLVLLSSIGTRSRVFIADRSKPMKSLGRLHNFLRKKLYTLADGLIVQTETAKDIYETSFKKLPVYVIGNPIRKIDVESVNRENIILTIGRLIKTKHHDRLIKIFSKINNSNWKLIIVGDNAQKQSVRVKLEKLIHELELEENIILAGKQKDVEKYYSKSKIFVFTSTSEGFPNVIGEAMSASLPVISYDCVAGPSDMIINSYNGFLIPEFDDELFLKKLNKLIEDETLVDKLGENAYKSIQRFNVEEVSQKFLNVIL